MRTALGPADAEGLSEVHMRRAATTPPTSAVNARRASYPATGGHGAAAAHDAAHPSHAVRPLSAAKWMVRNEPQFDAISASGDYPFLNSLFEHGEFELDLDELFEFGLLRTLDGVAMMIGETSA